MKNYHCFLIFIYLTFSLTAQIEIVDTNFGKDVVKKTIILPDAPKYDSLAPIQGIPNWQNSPEFKYQNIIGQQIYIPKGSGITFCDNKLKIKKIKDILDLNPSLKKCFKTPDNDRNDNNGNLIPYMNLDSSEIRTYVHNPDWGTISNDRNSHYSGNSHPWEYYYNTSVKSIDINDNMYFTIIDYGILEHNSYDDFYEKNLKEMIKKEEEYINTEDTAKIREIRLECKFINIGKYLDPKNAQKDIIEFKGTYFDTKSGVLIANPPYSNRVRINVMLFDKTSGDTLFAPFNEKMVSVGFYLKAKQLFEGKTFVVASKYKEKCHYNNNMEAYGTLEFDSTSEATYTDKFDGKEKILKSSNNKWLCEKVALSSDNSSEIFAFLKCNDQRLTIEVDNLIPIDLYKCNSKLYCLGGTIHYGSYQKDGFIREDEISAYNKTKIEKNNIENRRIEAERKLYEIERTAFKKQYDKKNQQENQAHLQNMINKYGVDIGTKIANKQISIGYTKQMCIDAKGSYYRVVYKNAKSEKLQFGTYLLLHFTNGILTEMATN